MQFIPTNSAALRAAATLLAVAATAGPLHGGDAAAQICAQVKIEIVQELTLERQAFDAKMKITNGIKGIDIENLDIDVTFADAQNNPVVATSDPNDTTASFFIKLDTLSGVDDVTGGGTIPGESAAEINWLIVPALGAAGPDPDGTLYFAGATVSYTLGGEERVAEVAPDTIYVRPMPQLHLDYFLPEQVHADNPYTLEIEPPTPFTLGVRVANAGFGPASNLVIESSQPKIVENELGLLVAFEIIGSTVNGGQATPTLQADFGTIESGDAGLARWLMTASLQGKFIEFSATFSHDDALGGKLTSLLEEVVTHTLVHDVLVEVAGRDSVRDFLADDNGTYRVYESDNVDTAVFDASPTAQLQAVGATTQVLTVDGGFAGFGLITLPDPLSGAATLVSVLRADGQAIRVPENAWLSKVWDKDSQAHTHYVNVFDQNNETGLSYTLEFGAAPVGNLPPTLDSTPNRKIRVGETLVYPVSASDPNDDALLLQAAPLPAGALFTDFGNGIGTLEWTPSAATLGGTYPVDFAAWDGQVFGQSTATFFVVGSETTNAPPVAASAALIAEQNQPSAPVTPTVNDADTDDQHFFSIASEPEHGTAWVADNQLLYLPDEDYKGLDAFQFVATDLFGESVLGDASVIVVDDTNLTAAGLDLEPQEDGTHIAAVELSNSGDAPTLVPVVIRVMAERCEQSAVLATTTQLVAAGDSTVSLLIDFATLPWADGAGLVLTAHIDAENALPEPDEFDNRVSQAWSDEGAAPFAARLVSSGATPETYCAAQVLTLTGRTEYQVSGASADCVSPTAAGVRVDYTLTDASELVVRSGTTFGASTGAWHLEFGLPTAVDETYDLLLLIDDGALVSELRSTLTTTACPLSIPPPMVPPPPYPGPYGDTPVVRFEDNATQIPWTVHPNMPIATRGTEGSGLFGHTRGIGNSTNVPSMSPEVGSTGSVGPDGFDAAVPLGSVEVDAGILEVGEVVTFRASLDTNDSYYGLPVRWLVLEPGAEAPVALSSTTWVYANGALTVRTAFTPRVEGPHTVRVDFGPGYSDADPSNDTAAVEVEIEPDPSATAPVLLGLTPAQGTVGEVVSVAVAAAKLDDTATLSCGPGIAVSALDYTSLVADELGFYPSATATLSIAVDAGAGARDCILSTQFGASVLPDAFEVLEFTCAGTPCTAPPSACHVSTLSCDPDANTCVYALVAAGTPCDDGIACTVGDSCDAFGACGAPVDLDCNDGIACTADTCDLEVGCINAPTDASCDPGQCLQGGDLNGIDPEVTITDVLCSILTSIWVLGGETEARPDCLVGPTELADLNCSGVINVADVQLIISLALDVPYPSGVDRNANQCSDACEVPDCGDATCGADEECLVCSDDCGGCGGSCCAPHATAGCSEATVQECVCAIAPNCCYALKPWTLECAAVAVDSCGATCN